MDISFLLSHHVKPSELLRQSNSCLRHCPQIVKWHVRNADLLFDVDFVPVTHAAGETAGTLRELAGRMLAAYRGHAVDDRAEVIGIEQEALFRLVNDAPPLKARMDLIEAKDCDLIVTDFKTSRSRWSESKAAESLPQMIVYAHAVMPLAASLGCKRIIPRFVVITKAKSPVVQVIEPKPTSDDVTRLRELVTGTWDAIRKEAWLRRESWQCKQCPYAKRCLEKTE